METNITSRLRKSRLGISLCLVIASQVLIARNTRQQVESQNRLLGHTTAQQAMTLASPMFQALLSPQQDLLLTNDASEMPNMKSQLHRYWVVECVDSQGTAKAHLRIDADSYEILAFSRSEPIIHTPHAVIKVPAKEAVARARTYLAILGHRADWHLISVDQSNGIWKVDLITGKRRAYLNIDAEDGALRSTLILCR
jgi:hypothetical protein